MKKLKLTAFQLGTTEILTRQQLRNVLGGAVGPVTSTTNDTLSSGSGANCSMHQCLGFACTAGSGPAGGCICTDGGSCSTSHPNP
jgi:hypothetical protein